ncbi:c-type cytochrome [Marinovum sp. 2_MG-2023]|uniref:c-type cytochrome n=1 Tax=unclassified Marinovum TaxID=2647166 RepID=UPI0026E40B60|nr:MULTISPECIES: c-type cytochrome [unclassified Marinovum]MDO6730003.1 c-type cytochrome [Marinovum sp. 2_MG-2023]MDO6779817.1 c-type cytochrome [Marinovum sp. 1_MG-2023]
MNRLVLTSILTLALAVPALAESHDPDMAAVDLTATGDVAKGEKAFKKCQSCHVVKNDAGEVLAGRAAKTGPNLFAVAGRTAGTLEGYRYGNDLVAAGEAGLVYDEARFVTYVMDPKAAIQEVTGDGSARSKMSYKVRKEDEAKDLYAFLLSLAPPAETAESGS